MALPFAHIGHWTTSLMYVAPVAVIVVVLWWLGLRDRRRDEAAGEGAPDVERDIPTERREPPTG